MRPRLNGPFIISVREIVRRPGQMRKHFFSHTLTEPWGDGIVTYDAGSEVDVDVRLESVHEGILASGTVDAEYSGVCGRCLTDIARPVEVEFQDLFAYPGDEETDFAVHDDHVDLEPLVRDAVVLSLPFQPVCQPDCPGIDPMTGEKLAANTQTEQVAPIDPRWSVLQQITDEDGGAKSRTAEKEES